MTKEEAYEAARLICAGYGIDCPDPGVHVSLPDGAVGEHAWVIQAIKDARAAD